MMLLTDQDLTLPRHLNFLSRRKPSHTPTIVVGLDTETYEGVPFTVQLHSEDEPSMTALIWVNGRNVTKCFFDYLSKHCKPKTRYRFYAHNLGFDLVSVLFPFWRTALGQEDDIEFTFSHWNITGRLTRPSFVVIEKNDIRVELVDSVSWFATSLDKAARDFCPDLPKLEKPEGLGHQKFGPDDDLLVAYAKRDAQVVAQLGRLIEDMHEEFQVPPSMSLAHMSALIFKTHFIQSSIALPPPEAVYAGFCAAHGGKNYAAKGQYPKMHHNVYAYDLSSAYPFAMSQLPPFTAKHLYRHIRAKARDVRRAPVPGIYKVSGHVLNTERPIIYSHMFKPIEHFDGVWITGYELNEGLEKGVVKFQGSIEGWHYADDRTDSAMARFVHHFYEMKSRATNKVERFRSKIILNALYGKFIQKNQIMTPTTRFEEDLQGGGLFNPFIGASITGHTRAIMHHLEHELDGIHTATDGVICRKPAETNLGLPESGLGSLDHEGTGDLLLLRNKLYIFYGSPGKFPSPVLEGREVLKYAFHGYQGSLEQLEQMAVDGTRTYTVNRPNKVHESLVQNLTPNKFEDRQFTLKIGSVDWSEES